MYVCKSGNSYRTISTLRNTSSWKGSIRIIKSKRLLLEGPYKTEPHSEESFRTPRTLAVLVPCSVAWPWSQWRIFYFHPIWTSPDSVSFLCLVSCCWSLQREDQCLPITCSKRTWMGSPLSPLLQGEQSKWHQLLLMCLALKAFHCLSHSCLDTLKKSDVLLGTRHPYTVHRLRLYQCSVVCSKRWC